MKFDLVFEGGGAKGIAFVGAMSEFFARGHTLGRLLGTSAGAITATLLASGYGVDEIMAALAERDGNKSVFTDFLGTPARFDSKLFADGDLNHLLGGLNLPFVPASVESRLRSRLLQSMAAEAPGSNLFSLVELGGWYSADSFLSWLQRKLNEGKLMGKQRDFADLTLKEFAAATGTELTLVATDITQQLLLILNQRTAPDLPVRWATRMSMSIPLLWQDVTWQPAWGTYAGMDFSGHSIVDGGVLSNFPLALFLSQDKVITVVMGKNTGDDVIGMLLDEQLEVPGAPPAPPRRSDGVDLGSLKLARRIEGLVDTLLQAHDKVMMDAFEDKVVRLPAKGYGTTEFDMSDERREYLIAAGRSAMKAYLDALESSQKQAEKAPAQGLMRASALTAQADKSAAQILYSSLLLVK
jgi:NTE family protein